MRWNEGSHSPSQDAPAKSVHHAKAGKLHHSKSDALRCVPFLGTTWQCRRVAPAQSMGCLTSCGSSDVIEGMVASRSHNKSQTAGSEVWSIQGSFSQAQVKPTRLMPEDAPVSQPIPPSMDSARLQGQRELCKALAEGFDDAVSPSLPEEEECEEEVVVPKSVAILTPGVGVVKGRTHELNVGSRRQLRHSGHPAYAQQGSSSAAEDAVLRVRSSRKEDDCWGPNDVTSEASDSEGTRSHHPTLELSSSQFVRPAESSQFNLLYGENGKPPRPRKSLKLVVKHDRKHTWPHPAPAFESSTLYMTRRTNKYSNCQIQIQTARPDVAESKSSRTKWDSEMKKAEANIKRSLSLQMHGGRHCQQPECKVQENDIQAVVPVKRTEDPVQDFVGTALQQYKGWDGQQKPKTLHTLLAAMEVGKAVACVRYDKMLPRGETDNDAGHNNLLLQANSCDGSVSLQGKDPPGQNFDCSPVACGAPPTAPTVGFDFCEPHSRSSQLVSEASF